MSVFLSLYIMRRSSTYCYSNYYVSIGDPTVHLTTLLIGSVFFEGLKMTR